MKKQEIRNIKKETKELEDFIINATSESNKIEIDPIQYIRYKE